MHAAYAALTFRVWAGSPVGRVLKALAWAAIAVITTMLLVLHHPTGHAGRSVNAASVLSARPLSSALGPDGILRATRGSFNARGYRIVLARDGAPRFVRASAATAGAAAGFAAFGAGSAPAATGDNFWSDRFGDVGIATGGNVYAVAVSGSNIYIGGNFSSLGADSGIVASDVAMWDGHGWLPLGSGITGGTSQAVKALAVVGGKLYAGGNFTTAGGVSVNNLAMWNGSSWADVGGGVTVAGSCCASTPLGVNALAVSGSTLYVGGVFNDVGPSGATITAHSIAAWNTTTSTWSTLGSGIQYCSWVGTNCSASTGAVYALLVSGSKVYAGGWFTLAGGGEIESLAVWDGTSWSAVGGNGIRLGSSNIGTVDALAINTSTTPAKLYVGGQFDHVGATVSHGTATSPGVAASSVAQWNGTSWSALSSGANSCCTPTVYGLAYWNGRLFMSGNFDGAGGDGTPHIAQWDGSSWTAVGPGLDATPNALVSSSGGPIAVGQFGTANGTALLNDVGRWNGTAWSGYGLGTSLNAHATNTSPVTVLTTSGRTVYAGGTFSYAGWTPTNGQGFARFDGTSWHPMAGATVASGVGAVSVYGKYVFVGGQFSFPAVNGTANNIAVWDGSQWHALGGGLGGAVHALLVYQGKLWVGGSFANNVNAPSNIATWNLSNLATSNYGAGFSEVGGNPAYHGSGVYALAGWTYSSTVHYVLIGGNFQYITDGTTGYGTNSLLAYRVENTSTGAFDGYSRFAGANNTIGLTTSNGADQGDVYSLLVDGHNLYVGGAFTEAGNQAASGLALCDLTQQSSTNGCWQTSPATLTSSDSNPPSVRSMVKVESAYYLAGNFTSLTDASNNTVSASNIVQYTPGTHSFAPLGSGLGAAYSGPQAYALAQSPDGLYVGGLFGLAGGKPAATIGLWTGSALPGLTQKASSSTDTTGNPVTFTSTITNSSAITWSGLTLTETLPSGVQYDSSSISTGGSCTASTTTPVKLTCNIGSLNSTASGPTPTSATVAITVTPSATGKLSNSVALSASGYTNTASTTVTVS